MINITYHKETVENRTVEPTWEQSRTEAFAVMSARRHTWCQDKGAFDDSCVQTVQKNRDRKDCFSVDVGEFRQKSHLITLFDCSHWIAALSAVYLATLNHNIHSWSCPKTEDLQYGCLRYVTSPSVIVV